VAKDGQRVVRAAAKTLARSAVQRAGFDLVRVAEQALPPDFDEATAATIAAATPYTLTGPERLAALVESVRYLVRTEIPGDVVECGVWRGGSVLAVLRTLLELGVTDRDVWLYDTFTHMPRGGPRDVDLHGITADDYHARLDAGEPLDPAYSYLPLEEVKALLRDSGYPFERLHFVEGLVEETIPSQAPDRVALLRLDTDYYESTRHELEHLYPRISQRGVLIVDDYGHWRGSREAVDEYVDKHQLPVLLQRIDYSGRLVVVP
jgi:O-methyltransferase